MLQRVLPSLAAIMLVFGFLAAMALPAAAAEAPVFTGSVSGVAINGYDPVAYFTDAEPVAGDEAITTEWNGAVWRFASEDNKAAFVANPEKYAPQYGGYCAWAVSKGYTAKTDPRAWSVVDGKLYLNYSPGVQTQWKQDVPGNIAKGDANWPKVLN
jgi:YHS domain-containing protein